MAIKAITLDAYRTVLAMDRPFERFHRNLASLGIGVSEALAEEAMRDEMQYYRDHHLEGRDDDSVAELRRRCADVLFEYLAGRGVAVDLSADKKVDVLLESVKFVLYDDVVPFIDWCKGRGLRVAMLSNWDATLPEHLSDIGLAGHYEFAAVSATVGSAKPDPGIFEYALSRLGVAPDELVHVGDEYESDIVGAQYVGVRAVLIDRAGDEPDVSCARITALDQLPGLIESLAS